MIINCYGQLYRISKSGYKKYLKAVIAGREDGLDKFGARAIGIIEGTVTDISVADAQFQLEGLETRKKKKG